MYNSILPNRKDSLGSNFVTKLVAFMWSNHNNLDNYFEPDNNLWFENDNIYIQPFHKLCKIREKGKEYLEYENGAGGNIRIQQGKAIIEFKQDLISYFRERYKSNFENIIDNLAIKKGYKLPWKDNKNIICIHVRLSDNAHFNGGRVYDYDGSISGNYIKDLIDNNNLETFSQNNMRSYYLLNNKKDELNKIIGPKLDGQCAINIIKLENMILDLKKKYPSKDIHIITLLSDSFTDKKYKDLCNKYKIPIHSNDDMSYDAWLLINSDILVLSKSLFSIMTGYLHKGSQVYFPIWGVNVSLGLWTKYDKSNWIPYI